MNAVDTAQAAGSSTDLADIQSGEQRTQTITVTSRKVALDADKEPTEISREVKVFVRPLPFKRWLMATNFLTSILCSFPADTTIDINDTKKLGTLAALLVGNSQAEIIGLAMLATDQDEAFFDSIDLDDGVKIVLAVVEVNKDFFVQKVLPMFEAVAPQLKAKMQEIFGQTQLPS